MYNMILAKTMQIHTTDSTLGTPTNKRLLTIGI